MQRSERGGLKPPILLTDAIVPPLAGRAGLEALPTKAGGEGPTMKRGRPQVSQRGNVLNRAVILVPFDRNRCAERVTIYYWRLCYGAAGDGSFSMPGGT